MVPAGVSVARIRLRYVGTYCQQRCLWLLLPGTMDVCLIDRIRVPDSGAARQKSRNEIQVLPVVCPQSILREVNRMKHRRQLEVASASLLKFTARAVHRERRPIPGRTHITHQLTAYRC